MSPPTTDPRRGWLVAGTVVLVVMLVVSGIAPHERLTWLLEVFPILVVVPLLWATHARFPLTTLLYVLVFVHALVLMLGGAYTYARVPIGFEVADLLGLDRNPYDKLGHFMQGFVPAVAAREILVRGAHVTGRRMLVFLVLCVVLAVSACYELLEWAAALGLGADADSFLGTQGDPWDTQSDMFLALIGGIAALALLTRRHDRHLARLP
ncbi:MAG: DUF2238 domain-containing protein [Ectothiorhodospiraceae bacterium]|nr:DUF2238 domain-containing protein [Chromatiales bacterium]MCP5156518.1 DUF2238 domain-containing protein [Ectothiorhodospiraceae bacterium]